ncbi:MAG: hypothetical protein KKB66_13475 [Alphaproteobacteria bacterium]|nr:hypothetical protein [Alphaproteobacteria bacterium]MBU0805418.1 hypothetical protein [Alphaproteobacteria bacterium]MBU0873364.1 hypothetical protein [Alphaproteobacteria bacterium]MBU1401408.1 hypothetical protein [Alphaproteobacteria bacterium]MBU1592175.1 hypothetical protein [Alphaproteobacteria bacterium]
MTCKPAESKLDTDAGGDATAILRSLARRMIGFSGADVERLVREARQRARRDRRNVTYADLEALVAATQPPMSPEMRRRLAVHEAGHALVRILLGIGEITLITIEAAGGEAFTESLATNDIIETAGACRDYIVALMAGRAAEQVVFGSVLAGSGGAIRSDLAQATKLATAAETSLGFGSRQPLLYRDPDHWQILLQRDARLARRVHSRLAKAERSARRIVRQNRHRLDLIVDELVSRGTLEGADLAGLSQVCGPAGELAAPSGGLRAQASLTSTQVEPGQPTLIHIDRFQRRHERSCASITWRHCLWEDGGVSVTGVWRTCAVCTTDGAAKQWSRKRCGAARPAGATSKSAEMIRAARPGTPFRVPQDVP